MIDFNLDPGSGVAPYMQLVHQVRRALRLGLLQVGDQLPTVKQVVTASRSTRTPSPRRIASWNAKAYSGRSQGSGPL